jgi:hypothetical protein
VIQTLKSEKSERVCHYLHLDMGTVAIQWVTIIILNNSNVPKMRKEKHFKRPRLKENGTKGCREQKLESHSKPIPPELTNLPRWDHKSM